MRFLFSAFSGHSKFSRIFCRSSYQRWCPRGITDRIRKTKTGVRRSLGCCMRAALRLGQYVLVRHRFRAGCGQIRRYCSSIQILCLDMFCIYCSSYCTEVTSSFVICFGVTVTALLIDLILFHQSRTMWNCKWYFMPFAYVADVHVQMYKRWSNLDMRSYRTYPCPILFSFSVKECLCTHASKHICSRNSSNQATNVCIAKLSDSAWIKNPKMNHFRTKRLLIVKVRKKKMSMDINLNNHYGREVWLFKKYIKKNFCLWKCATCPCFLAKIRTAFRQ